MATSLSHSSLSSISHLCRTSPSSTSSPSHLHFPSSSLPPIRLSSSRRASLPPVYASADSTSSISTPPASLESPSEPAASAAGDSVVAEVASLPEAGDTEGVAGRRRGSPLERGGTLRGDGREGKDPSAATLGKSSLSAFAAVGEKFEDPRWKNGTWDVAMFAKDGKVDWDAVIDAEVLRRKWLEENPVSSTNEDPVVFDTSIVPWWAWVRRFHLPEAEKLNGRAAMVGYALGYLVDAATGVGLVDQSNGFIGKLLILISVLGILVIRKTEDVQTIKDLAQEWTFYDKQWQATWKEGPPRGGEEAEK